MNDLLQERLDQYKQWLIANNKSKNTVINYVPKVKSFLESLNVEKLSDITSEMITNYCANNKSTGGQEKANQIMKALRSFLINANELNLRFPKYKNAVSKRVKRAITESELKNFIEPKLQYIFSNPLQVKALIYFLFYTGFRKNEIIALHRSDFNWDTNRVTAFATKQSIQRTLPLNDNLVTLIKKYFAVEAEEENAFNTSTQKIRMICNKLQKSKILGEQRKIWPHLWRDSFACHLINHKVTLRNLQVLMGHKRVEDTMQYLQMCQSDIDEDFLEKIKGIC